MDEWEVEPVNLWDGCAACGARGPELEDPFSACLTPGCRREYPEHRDVLAPDARAAAHVYGWTWLRPGRVADVWVRGATVTVTRWRVERSEQAVTAAEVV